MNGARLASQDVVYENMVKRMAEALMDAEVDALCGAAHGERHPERVNRRNVRGTFIPVHAALRRYS
ncbi:MAG TPA: transposase [Coriobacteriia bacterium]